MSRTPRAAARTLTEGRRARALLPALLVVVAAAVLHLVTPASLGGYTTTVTNSTNRAASGVWATTCLAQAKADSTYLFWRLDEASGTSAADASGSGFPATYTSSGISYRSTAGPCPRDTQSNVVTLDGSRGYIYGPRFGTAPTTLTEEIWFKTTQTNGGKLIGLGDRQTGASTNYDRMIYMTNAGNLVFGIRGTAVQTVTSPDTYRDGAWHHAVGTLAPSGPNKGLTLYVDGAAVASNPGYTTGSTVANLYVRVGYDAISNAWPSAPRSAYFQGSLADVALYPSALPPEQVLAHYNTGIGD